MLIEQGAEATRGAGTKALLIEQGAEATDWQDPAPRLCSKSRERRPPLLNNGIWLSRKARPPQMTGYGYV